MKTIKIDFALLSIISLIATHTDSLCGIFRIAKETWKTLDIIFIVFFIVFAVLEKIEYIINKRNESKQEYDNN